MTDSEDAGRPLDSTPYPERGGDVDMFSKPSRAVSVAEPEAQSSSSSVPDGGQSKQFGALRGFRGSSRRSQWAAAQAPDSSDSPMDPGKTQETPGSRKRRSGVVIGAVAASAVGVFLVALVYSADKPSSGPVAARRGADQTDLVSLGPGFAQATALPTKTATATHRPSPSPSLSSSVRQAGPSTAARSTTSVVVAPSTVPPAAGDWLLNQTGGDVAVDSTGAHNGWADNGWWVDNSCLFNGSNSSIYTSGPVLATGTGASFTISAWVYLDAIPANGQDATAISQDGGQNSGFYLQYAGSAGRWAFSRVTNDSGNGGTEHRALSTNAPALTTFTHLVGVYDATNATLRLYVNGVAQGTATDTTPFASNGDFVFGRAQHNGQDSDWLKGAIKDVAVYNVALNATQVSKLN